MRRGASIAVLAVLLAGVLAPLAQLTASTLPACCRTGGQHHCMGAAGLDGFHSQAQRCPFRTHPAVVGGVVALLNVDPSRSLLVAQSRLVTSMQVEPVRPSFDTLHKRGPPQS